MEWLDDSLRPKLKKENSIIVLSGILRASGKKQITVWEWKVRGTISANTYMDHIPTPSI